ncbi:hypothetical protein [Terasakiella pusilla]|uniref:hypothetical protein n=1 Tax=Terasakiella pusilla TaxID=64973 RepID=UPI003AA8CADA
MRLKDFTTTPYPDHTRSAEIEENSSTKIFTVFLRITGTLNLSYRPKEKWVQIYDLPVNEFGSDISIERLGMGDGYLIMADCYGIYPIIVDDGENFKSVILTAENSMPYLWTERGRHKFDDVQIHVGSCQMTDFDNRQSITLIRSVEFFKEDEAAS